MKVYTYSEARQRLASLLDQARRDGAVRIRRRDGQMFLLSPATPLSSPLDVPGVKTSITAREIVDVVRAGRRQSASSR